MARRAVNAEDAWSKAMMARFLELQVMSEMQISQNAERMAQQQKEYLEFRKEYLEFHREMQEFRANAEERFGRIEQTLAAVLRVLERLPDTIREKIGFGISER